MLFDYRGWCQEAGLRAGVRPALVPRPRRHHDSDADPGPPRRRRLIRDHAVARRRSLRGALPSRPTAARRRPTEEGTGFPAGDALPWRRLRRRLPRRPTVAGPTGAPLPRLLAAAPPRRRPTVAARTAAAAAELRRHRRRTTATASSPPPPGHASKPRGTSQKKYSIKFRC